MDMFLCIFQAFQGSGTERRRDRGHEAVHRIRRQLCDVVKASAGRHLARVSRGQRPVLDHRRARPERRQPDVAVRDEGETRKNEFLARDVSLSGKYCRRLRHAFVRLKIYLTQFVVFWSWSSSVVF